MMRIWKVFWFLGKQILRDKMLTVLLAAPVLAGGLFRFGIPAAEKYVTSRFHMEAVLSPYYLLIDLFYIILIPILYCYISAMVILEERDEKMALFFAVTPIGRKGYFFTRLGLPALLSWLVTIAAAGVFTLCDYAFGELCLLVSAGVLCGIMTALIIVVFSRNKVEGMAFAKASSLLSLGIPAVWVLKETNQYFLFFLPSLWMGKIGKEGGWTAVLCFIVTIVFWLVPLYKTFLKKV